MAHDTVAVSGKIGTLKGMALRQHDQQVPVIK